jgi:hypothetical protein
MRNTSPWNRFAHHNGVRARAPHESARSSSLLRFFRLVTIADARAMTADIEIMIAAEAEIGTTIATVDSESSYVTSWSPFELCGAVLSPMTRLRIANKSRG